MLAADGELRVELGHAHSAVRRLDAPRRVPDEIRHLARGAQSCDEELFEELETLGDRSGVGGRRVETIRVGTEHLAQCNDRVHGRGHLHAEQRRGTEWVETR